MTKKFQKWLNKWPKSEHAESRNSSMSRVSLASAKAKFRHSGHGSQAMPNNSKWYSSLIKSHIRVLTVYTRVVASKIYERQWLYVLNDG